MSAVDLSSSGMTLAPSTRGIGPNTYLGTRHFQIMLAVALLVHVVLFTIYGLWPSRKVTDIPVRALSFKIGSQNRVAALGQPEAISPVAPPSIQRPALTALPVPPPVKAPPKIEPPKPLPRQRPVENKPSLQPVIAPAPALAQPAIAPEPQRYIREYGTPSAAPVPVSQPLQGIAQGMAGGAGTESTMTASIIEQIRARYEQQISAWIAQHQLYPAEAGGVSGRVTMRVRVDRQGYVRYYAIERSSGNAALDRAAIEMIRRANPVPPAPADYPAENLIEFLIPILFEAP